jgi:hypothetical protein
MVATTAFSARSGWSISRGIRWSVSRGTGGQFVPESGGQYQRILHLWYKAALACKLTKWAIPFSL